MELRAASGSKLPIGRIEAQTDLSLDKLLEKKSFSLSHPLCSIRYGRRRRRERAECP